MKVGDFVRFDASLFSSDADCYTEMSLTMQGSLEEPEFVANFIRVSRVDLPLSEPTNYFPAGWLGP